MSIMEQVYQEYQELKNRLGELEQENQELKSTNYKQAQNIEDRFRELATLTNMLEEHNRTIEALESELSRLKSQHQLPAEQQKVTSDQRESASETIAGDPKSGHKASFAYGLHPDKWLEVGAELVCQNVTSVTVNCYLPKREGQESKELRVVSKGQVVQSTILERGKVTEITLQPSGNISYETFSFYCPEEPVMPQDKRLRAFVLAELKVA